MRHHSLLLAARAHLRRRLVPTSATTTTTAALPARHSSSASSSNTTFRQTPSPPRLPKEEQDLFERLQRQSTGAFSTPRPQVNQSPHSAADAASSSASPSSSTSNTLNAQQGAETEADATVTADVDVDVSDELHPHVFRGAAPEFQGEVNPRTGEVGGPKNEPLRWGHGGDWSYNGRVTDF